jgi:hypothetical protein
MIPARYLDTMGPLDGLVSMLELGNKNGTGGKGDSYKAHFEALGLRHVSVDWNGQDGALPLDLRKPLGMGVFSIVTNIGTSEHVDDQVPAWCNMIEAAALVLACITPAPGDWPGHGLFYPEPEFYVQLADRNGFKLEKLTVEGDAGRRLVHCRMRRPARVSVIPDLVMPDMGLLTVAPPRAVKKPRILRGK